MHEYKRRTVVQYTEDTSIQRYQRDHQNLERDDHRRDHQSEQGAARFPLVTHDHISRHGSEQDRKYGGKNRYNRRVSERTPEVHLLHGFREVLHSKSMASDQSQRIGSNICLCLKYVDHYQYKRKDKADEQGNQNNNFDCMVDLFITSSSFIRIHYADTSAFLPMLT